MLLNNVLGFIHKYTEQIYNNSVILKNLDKLIYLLILITYVLSAFVNSDSIGYCAIVLLALSTIRVIFNPNDNFKIERFELFLLLYFLILIITLAGSSLFYLSLKGLMKTLVYIGFYISVVHHLKYNKQNILPILITISCCSAFESFVGISQSFAKVEEISGWQDISNINPEEVINRVYGTLLPLNPNLLGGYFVMSIPASIGLFSYYLYEKKYILSAVFGIFAATSCTTLFLTGCRGAYIGLFFIIISVFLISLKILWSKYKKLLLTISSALTAITTLLLMAITPLRVRIFSIFAMRNDSSNSFRFNVYRSSFQMFKDNWLLGIGHGNQNFREIYGLYMKTGFDALSSYNIYLELAVETGILGLICFIGFLVTLIYDGIKFILNKTDIKSIIITSVPLLTFIGTMVHGIVDTVFFRPQLQLIFWSMCAILSNQLYSNKEITI